LINPLYWAWAPTRILSSIYKNSCKATDLFLSYTVYSLFSSTLHLFQKYAPHCQFTSSTTFRFFPNYCLLFLPQISIFTIPLPLSQFAPIDWAESLLLLDFNISEWQVNWFNYLLLASEYPSYFTYWNKVRLRQSPYICDAMQCLMTLTQHKYSQLMWKDCCNLYFSFQKLWIICKFAMFKMKQWF